MNISNHFLQINKPNYSPQKTIVMKNFYLLSKLAGIILLFLVVTQSAAASVPQTPYQKLKKILNEYYIYKDAVTDELTETEIERISVDVAVQFKVPLSVAASGTTIGEMLTNILMYKYSNRKGEKWAWEKIRYSSDANDYVFFLILYPNSKHRVEASSKYIATLLHEAYINLMYICLDEPDSIYEAFQQYLELYQSCIDYYDFFVREYKYGSCGIQCTDYEGFSYINFEKWVKDIKEYIQEKDEERQSLENPKSGKTHKTPIGTKI